MGDTEIKPLQSLHDARHSEADLGEIATRTRRRLARLIEDLEHLTADAQRIQEELRKAGGD